MKIDESYRIDRIIGNNVVLVKDAATEMEFVLFGKGLGFASKAGGSIDGNDPRIEKRFRLDDHDEMRNYRSLLEDLAPEVIQISEEIIQMVSDHFEKKVNSKAYFALPSHIHFAVYRLKNGMDIVNPFLYETKMIFPKEYEIACRAAELLRDTFGIDIPEDEIGFLAYHIRSGITDVSVGQIIKYTTLINRLIAAIERSENVRIPKQSADYARLITHFRYMIERILQRKKANNPFLPEIKTMYKREYALALELSRQMKEQLHEDIPEDEIGFIVMHLYRLFQSLELDDADDLY